MSGPKRADVQAELRAAHGAAQRASSLVAEAEYAVLRALLGDLDRATQRGFSTSSAENDLARARDDVPSKRDAKVALALANSLRDRANAAADAARAKLREADRAHQSAVAEYGRASSEYDNASRALDRSVGDHYKQSEMNLAREASRRFNVAADLGKAAAQSRLQARSSVGEALALARQAQAAADEVNKRAAACARESEERTRAEEEARRIAEEVLRRATVAVNSARAALSALPAAECDKFAPSSLGELTRRIETAEGQLAQGDSAAAQQLADAVGAEAPRLAAKVAAARAEYDHRLTSAQTAVDELNATLGAVDAKLIGQWSDDPDAVAAAQAALQRADDHIAAERFEDAASDASGAAAQLRGATNSAAESQAANDRRISIGDAIMDVLEDMGFRVFSADGTKNEPLKITGQVPDESGRGDFKLEIPLTGDVDFEVAAAEGDGSCSGAVKELRERLAERGVGFTVTDWGYGHEPGGGQLPVQTETETQTQLETQTG